MSKIEKLTMEGLIFFNTSEMTLTFINSFNKITFENYLIQPKSMPEWRLIEKLARIPKLMKAFDKTLSYPLLQEYSTVNILEKQDQNMELML